MKETLNYLNNSSKVEIKYIQFFEGMKKLDTLESIKNIIILLRKICQLIMLLFCLLFIIIIRNLIHDEYSEMIIEKLIGYKTVKTKQIIALKVLSMDLIIFQVSIISNILIKIVFKFLLNNYISIFNKYVLYLNIFMILISLIQCNLYKDKSV